MHIIIKEENGFMPTTTIKITENKIEVEENNKLRILKYQENEIKKIMEAFLIIFKNWKDKYVKESIIDDEIYSISIVSSKIKTIYIKNDYPQNWEKFIVLRNHLVREDLDFE